MYVSLNETISVYKFMGLCGLYCNPKRKQKISHLAMQRKLYARSEIFPDEIIMPQALSFSTVNSEDILNGKIVMVKDDCGKIIAYKNPRLLIEKRLLEQLANNANKEELRIIRERILQEQGYTTQPDGEIITIEEKKLIEKDDYLEVTEKVNRVSSFSYKGGRNLKRKNTFRNYNVG